MATHYCRTHPLNAAVPMQKVSEQMQKHKNTASSKKTENHVEPSVRLRAHFETRPTTPAPVAHASLLFTAPEAPFTRKNTMFRANPNIQVASMMCENEAFVRCFLQFPELEDVTFTTLSCKTQ